MLNTSFSDWPSFSKEEIIAVADVLKSNKVNYWTGDICKKFETEFASWCESKFAVALSNGTVALELAINALKIGEGDEVIVTPRSFIASISSIVNAGAKPIFADVDLESQNITPNSIRKVITKKTKAIICVHLSGWPCDMDEIMDIANEHCLYVIEDCAQAHGAKYKNTPVGSIGHIGCWSFCQDKIMTTGGEGGMITTNDEKVWKTIWSYKDHGKSFEAIFKKNHPKGFKWLHESFGTNGRMTEMQAVIGRIQLKKMSKWHKTRLINAKTIWNNAKKCDGLIVPNIPNYIEHAAYKCYVFVELDKLKDGWDNIRIIEEINRLGVPCYSGSCSEVYLEKAFENTKFRPNKRLCNAKKLGETSLMFLVHPTLLKDEIKKTCYALKRVMYSALKYT